jgi:hypothetical protein
MTKLKLLIVALVAVLLVPSVSWAAATISWTSPGVIRAGLGAVSATILNLAVKGSFLARGGNFICENAANPDCGFVSGNRAEMIPFYGLSPATATGGLAKYDSIRIPSPFRSAVAATRGHRTGTGVIQPGIQLHILANPKGASLDCTKTAAANTATGGTVYFNNVSATGSVVTYDSSIVLGPNENFKCGTNSAAVAGLSFEIRGRMNDSAVTN